MTTKLTRVLATAALLLGALALPRTAQAAPDLSGLNIAVDWLYPDSATVFASDIVNVGPGVEIACPGGGVGPFNLCSGFVDGATIDIGADTVRLDITFGVTPWTASSFNGYRFSDLSAGGPWGGFALVTGFAGLDDARVSLSPDGSTLLVNMQGITPSGSEGSNFFEITLLPAKDVPEPATLLLLGAGLTAAALRRRSRA